MTDRPYAAPRELHPAAAHHHLLDALLPTYHHRVAYQQEATFHAQVETIARAVAEMVDQLAHAALERITTMNAATMAAATGDRSGAERLLDELTPDELADGLARLRASIADPDAVWCERCQRLVPRAELHCTAL